MMSFRLKMALFICPELTPPSPPLPLNVADQFRELADQFEQQRGVTITPDTLFDAVGPHNLRTDCYEVARVLFRLRCDPRASCSTASLKRAQAVFLRAERRRMSRTILGEDIEAEDVT